MKSRKTKKLRADKHGQFGFFRRSPSDHGGVLRRKLSGRGSRPLAIKHSMHLVLRSSLATGELSFRKGRNERKIISIIKKFSQTHSVRIISFANVGNHLHLHIQLGSRLGYKAFIRAITGAIALAIRPTSRFKKCATKFWDERPFTRIVQGFNDQLRLGNYIRINALEGFGVSRAQAKIYLALSTA